MGSNQGLHRHLTPSVPRMGVLGGGYVTGLAQGAIPFSSLGHCLTPAEIRDGLR